MQFVDRILTSLLTFAAAIAVCALAAAQCPAADAFEPNQSCTAAAPITTGTWNGLTVWGSSNASGVNDDFFCVNLPAGEVLIVDCLFVDAWGDVDVYLYDASTGARCGGESAGDYLVRGFSASDDEHVSFTNQSATAMSIIVRVELYSSHGCNDYGLIINTTPDPCGSLSDDELEPNDLCGTAIPLASGLHFDLFVAESNPDFYTLTVPPNHILAVDVEYLAGAADPDLYLYSDSACALEVKHHYSYGGSGLLSWLSPGAAPSTVVLEVRVPAGEGCTDYELNIFEIVDPCQMATDDAFEPNDVCGAAIALPTGLHAGLYVSDSDADHYLIDVPSGERLTIDVTYLPGVNPDPDFFLYEQLSCTVYADWSLGNDGVANLSWTNASAAAKTLVLQVRVPAGQGCNSYDMLVATAPDACLDPQLDDGFEDNDSCANAITLVDGTYAGLKVGKHDHDFYRVGVESLQRLSVHLAFTHATADVDVYIYDDPLTCGDINNYLERGYTTTDDEHVSWTNSSGQTQTYYIQVVVFAYSSGECNDYDMQLSGSGAVLAEPFCFGDGSAEAGAGPVGCPCGNSSTLGAGEGCARLNGSGAILSASGSSIVGNDDLVMTISQARANQPGILLQGASRAALPFKDGVLCVGNPTERVEIVFTNSSGSGSTSNSIATNGHVLPGQTRHYQQWYRDPGGQSPCGNGSNFTQALTLTWF